MNLTRLSNVILILGLLLLLPLTPPPTTIDLAPFRPEKVVINIHAKSIVINSDTDQPVHLNISYMDSNRDKLIFLQESVFLHTHIYEVPPDKQGNFLFSLQSTVITKITIREKGVFIFDLSIIAVLLSIMLILNIRKRYTVSLNY